MYVSKVFLYQLATFVIFAMFIYLVRQKRKPLKTYCIVNLVYGENSVELYKALKLVGVTLDDEQKGMIEAQLKQSCKQEVGFMG